MPIDFPSHLPRAAIEKLLLAMADDELILGHRDSEWTGHAPILEEDIAFSNIAQDEIGHSLVWFTLLQELTGQTPDEMGFERDWSNFTCCRFVAYPRGDFAYSVVRQFLFDEAEKVRLEALRHCPYAPMKEAAGKILREEAYHVMHCRGLIERLGKGTPESHERMHTAIDTAFPQALGMFEVLEEEEKLVEAGIFSGHTMLQAEWLKAIHPILTDATLSLPIERTDSRITVRCVPDAGGRRHSHTEHLKHLVDDLQQVYRSIPNTNW